MPDEQNFNDTSVLCPQLDGGLGPETLQVLGGHCEDVVGVSEEAGEREVLSLEGLVPDLYPRPLLAVLWPHREDVAQALPVDGGGWWWVPVDIQPSAQCGDLLPQEGGRAAGSWDGSKAGGQSQYCYSLSLCVWVWNDSLLALDDPIVFWEDTLKL